MVWGARVGSGVLVAGHGMTHIPLSVPYAGRAWATAQEAEVAVCPSPCQFSPDISC